jgi:hypothetical protein
METFTNWLAERHYFSAPHGVVPIVARMGRLTRKELGQQITLDPRLLDSLLAAYVAFGLLAVSQENGERVYRTAWGGSAY